MSITGYPYHSVPANVLQSLDLIGFPLTFASLYVTSLASRIRMAMKFHVELEDGKVQLDAAKIDITSIWEDIEG